MGQTLRTVQFSAQLLHHVVDFECGTDPWVEAASLWIKQAPPFRGALFSMQQRGNAVGLHFLDVCDDDSYLVGFSSLGTIRSRVPSSASPEVEAGYIPMLAVSKLFQGRSPYISVETAGGSLADQECTDIITEKTNYSRLIMNHLLSEAKQRGFKHLCLLVHPENTKAISLYCRYGFKATGGADNHGNVKMSLVIA